MNYKIPPQPIDESDPSSVSWNDWYTKVRFAMNQSGLDFSDLTNVPPNLIVISPLSDLGFLARTATTPTWVLRTFLAGAGISISNPQGIAGDPTWANTGVLSNIGTANQIAVSGATGNVTFTLPAAIITPGSLTVTTNLVVTGVTALNGAVGLGDAVTDTLSVGGVTVKDANGRWSLGPPTSGDLLTLTAAASSTALNIASGAIELAGSAGSSGQVLTSAGSTATPTWSTLSGVAVTSITGTANQITASASVGAVTLSIPSSFIAPGSITATTTLLVTTDLTVNGNTSLGDAIGDTLTVSGNVVKSATGNWLIAAPSTGDALILNAVTGGRMILAESSLSGNNAVILLSNTSNTASSSTVNAIRVGGASAGDPWYRMDILGVQSWSMGIRNSDSDSWILGTGTDLSVPIIRVSTAGNVLINAPSTGTALTINGIGNTVQITDTVGTARITLTGTVDNCAFDLVPASGKAGFIRTTNSRVLNFGVNSTDYLSIGVNGNLTVVSPSSGIPLSVGAGISGAVSISYSGSIGEGADTTLSSSGTTLLLGNSSTWTALRLLTNGTNRIEIASGGNVTINAASSGDELTITGSLVIGDNKIMTTTVAFTNGAAAAAGTLLNAPAAGNPTKWIPVNDNGTTRYIPAW